jgi:hypothetical protein
MPNITVSVTQSVYNDARIYAAQTNTSVSAFVEFCLQNLRSLNFNPAPGIVMLRNRQSKASAARAREQAARAARMAAYQARANETQSTQN